MSALANSPKQESTKPTRPVVSIRLIATSVALAVTTVAVLGVGTVTERNSRIALTAEIESRLFLEGQSLAWTSAGALLSDFPELTLHPLVKEIQLEQTELGLVIVVDHEQRIQGHADSRRLGMAYQPISDLVEMEVHGHVSGSARLLGNDELLVVETPVTTPAGQRVGTAYVGLHRRYIDGLLADTRRQVIFLVTLVLAVGCAVTLLTMTQLLRPIASLREGLERIGRGHLDTKIQLKDRTELGLLADTVNQMASELRHAQTEMVEKQRLSHEIDLAQDIQQSLLPTKHLESGSFLIDGTQRAAAEVGGDYYDFFHLPDGRVGIAIADVSGKGLAGCMVMSMLSALLRAFKGHESSPAALLSLLDERISENLRPGTFITMFYGVLDPETGVMTYASAAHSPLFIYRRATGSVERRLAGGIPLGSIRGGAVAASLKDEDLELEQGDLLLQYTDGINEAFAPDGGQQFGFERLEAVLVSEAAQGGSKVITRLNKEVDRWTRSGPRQDDETLVVVSRELAEVRSASGSRILPPRFRRPLSYLSDARSRTEPLSLVARLDDLEGLRPWLAGQTQLSRLSEEVFEVLHTAVYEACANIVEHGYAGDSSRDFEIFWVPTEEKEGPEAPRGYLLIRDQGKPYTADNWKESDFTDPEIWRRGRGFGLDIIHRAMAHVVYSAGTDQGNLTMLIFEPDELEEKRMNKHA